MLQELGASLVFFSPLADEASPQANAVYLPGGYPELYLPVLAQNDVTRRWLQEHVQAGRALYAECGGMLYLLDWLEAVDGCRESMAGIMPGHACMQKRLEKLGHQEVDLGAGLLRGHTFHYSRAFVKAAPLACARHPQTGQEGEPVWRLGSQTASYLHLYFPCHPAAAAALFTRPENSGPVLPITSPDPDVIRSFPEL